MARYVVPIAIALGVLLTGPAIAGDDAKQAKADRKTAWMAAKPVGEALSCVPLRSIKNTRVRSDEVIDFYMNGGKVYRNTLPHGCPQLGFEERFAYKTSLSQLCSTDIITVLQSGGGLTAGASCGLGKFQPVEGAPR